MTLAETRCPTPCWGGAVGWGVCKTAENWGSGQWWLELWVNRNVWKKTHPMRENEREKIKQIFLCIIVIVIISRNRYCDPGGLYANKSARDDPVHQVTSDPQNSPLSLGG